MNAMVAQLWVEALRSGRFKQGRGKLCKIGKTGKMRHDVLGVLMELAMDAGVPVFKVVSLKPRKVWYVDGDCNGTRYSFEEQKLSDCVLTPNVRKWAGLFSPQSVLRLGDEVQYLCGLNDDGVTLNELANIIEANANQIS